MVMVATPPQKGDSLVLYHIRAHKQAPRGPENKGNMLEPSDNDIRGELLRQSDLLFGDAGWGGVFGPAKEQYNRHRPKGWPWSGYLLRTFGLTRGADEWGRLLQAFGLMPPGPREIREASQRRNHQPSTRPSIPLEDESYPELVGSLVDEAIRLTPLGDGRYLRTTTSVYQLR